MAIKARIWWDEQAQCYQVSLPYNEKFIETLKLLIPSGDRMWDPATKIWFIKDNYGQFLRQLAETAFGVGCVSFTSKDVAQQARTYNSTIGGGPRHYNISPSTATTTEDAIVAFFSLLPYNAAKRAYLQASQELHPDKPTGDAVKMTKLNELWSRIEKEFFKR
jgi:hypothetical protein